MSDFSLQRMERARLALRDVRDALSAKRIADVAKAAEVYAIRQKNEEAAKYAHEIRVEALRLEGEFLAAEPKNTGARGVGPIVVTQGNRNATPTLASQGISKKESSVAQMVAKAAKEAPAVYEAVRSGGKINDIRRHFKKREHAAKVERAKSAPKQSRPGPCDIILADPPWTYEAATTDPTRVIDNHYPTASLEEIAKHKPDAKPNSLLLLWATAPKLDEALGILKAWGFLYRTHAVWDKTKIGMGYWFRVQHEILLVGIRGSFPTPPESERVASIFTEARSSHSTKPECVYSWLERAYPEATKLEMYCRTPRPGWAFTGNEVCHCEEGMR